MQGEEEKEEEVGQASSQVGPSGPSSLVTYLTWSSSGEVTGLKHDSRSVSMPGSRTGSGPFCPHTGAREPGRNRMQARAHVVAAAGLGPHPREMNQVQEGSEESRLSLSSHCTCDLS